MTVIITELAIKLTDGMATILLAETERPVILHPLH